MNYKNEVKQTFFKDIRIQSIINGKESDGSFIINEQNIKTEENCMLSIANDWKEGTNLVEIYGCLQNLFNLWEGNCKFWENPLMDSLNFPAVLLDIVCSFPTEPICDLSIKLLGILTDYLPRLAPTITQNTSLLTEKAFQYTLSHNFLLSQDTFFFLTKILDHCNHIAKLLSSIYTLDYFLNMINGTFENTPELSVQVSEFFGALVENKAFDENPLDVIQICFQIFETIKNDFNVHQFLVNSICSILNRFSDLLNDLPSFELFDLTLKQDPQIYYYAINNVLQFFRTNLERLSYKFPYNSILYLLSIDKNDVGLNALKFTRKAIKNWNCCSFFLKKKIIHRLMHILYYSSIPLKISALHTLETLAKWNKLEISIAIVKTKILKYASSLLDPFSFKQSKYLLVTLIILFTSLQPYTDYLNFLYTLLFNPQSDFSSQLQEIEENDDYPELIDLQSQLSNIIQSSNLSLVNISDENQQADDSQSEEDEFSETQLLPERPHQNPSSISQSPNSTKKKYQPLKQHTIFLDDEDADDETF